MFTVFSPHDYFNLFSNTTQDQLPSVGPAHSGSDPSPNIINQESP